MNRIDRLFGISTLLQSRRYVTAEAIADKFEISVRTVYRDIKALGEHGIPISFEPAKGYFIVNGYFLPPVAFSSEEANALLLMESMVSAFSDLSIQKHYTSALQKVKAVLKHSQKEKIETLTQNIRFQVPARLENNYEHMAMIQNAVSNKSILEMEYKNNSEEQSRRQVEPIGLIFYAFSWHVIGWCHFRNDYRDFRVSRIISVWDTQLPFRKEQHMELSEYMKQLPVNY